MVRFLLDENISHETADFLNSLGYDTKTVAHFDLLGAEDLKIVELAVKEKRVLITLDLDFGEIFYFSSNKKLGVIVLRLNNQTVESVNLTLRRLLESRILKEKLIRDSLIIVSEGKVRIRRKPEKLERLTKK
ncbi:MAG: DUF5615 family PIN-like protein [Patescibacteria group bacterium]